MTTRAPQTRYPLPDLNIHALLPAEAPWDTPISKLADFSLYLQCECGRGGAYPLRLLSAQIGWNVPLRKAVARFKCKTCGTPFGSVRLGPVNSGDGHSSARAGMIDLVAET